MPFTDVSRDGWAYAPVHVGYYGQAGSNAVTFRPNAKSTREDVAMAVVKAMAAEQAIDILDTETAASEVLSQFKDATTISPGRRVYVATAVLDGILRGLRLEGGAGGGLAHAVLALDCRRASRSKWIGLTLRGA